MNVKDLTILTQDPCGELFRRIDGEALSSGVFMKRQAKDVTQERLRALLSYDPVTGVFVWLATRGNAMGGSRAGNVRLLGRNITIDGVQYPAARLAWFWVHNEWPRRLFRFKDGDTDNAAIGNLTFGKHDFTSRAGQTAYLKEWRKANPRSQRAISLRRMFGMELADFQAMLVEQNGVCAICSKPETEVQKGKLLHLSVDHDHSDHSIRGLLCAACNKGLGHFKDAPDLLRAAVSYLDLHASKPKTNVIPLGARRVAKGA